MRFPQHDVNQRFYGTILHCVTDKKKIIVKKIKSRGSLKFSNAKLVNIFCVTKQQKHQKMQKIEFLDAFASSR